MTYSNERSIERWPQGVHGWPSYKENLDCADMQRVSGQKIVRVHISCIYWILNKSNEIQKCDNDYI